MASSSKPTVDPKTPKSILKNKQAAALEAAAATAAPKYYFAYGSNLSITQMQERCPASAYVGVGALEGWTWRINERGFANIVEVTPKAQQPLSTVGTGPAPPLRRYAAGEEADEHPVVFGLVYTLPPADERLLDGYEGVPYAYTKEMLRMRVWSDAALQDGGERLKEAQFTAPDPETAAGGPETPTTKRPPVGPCEVKEVLAYVDRERTTSSEPRAEYVKRMQRGVVESSEYGMPVDWMRATIGDFIDLDPVLKQ